MKDECKTTCYYTKHFQVYDFMVLFCSHLNLKKLEIITGNFGGKMEPVYNIISHKDFDIIYIWQKSESV